VRRPEPKHGVTLRRERSRFRVVNTLKACFKRSSRDAWRAEAELQIATRTCGSVGPKNLFADPYRLIKFLITLAESERFWALPAPSDAMPTFQLRWVQPGEGDF